MRIKTRSYGSRLIDSFVGVLIGVILFFGSFIVLFMNEGRENFAKVASQAVLYNENNDQDGLFVYKIGSLEAQTYAIDHYLQAYPYIYIERIVEMYAFVETEHRETRENFGGSETTIYTYTYRLEWESLPIQSTTFKGSSSERPNVPANYNTWIQNMPQNRNSLGSNLSINGIQMSLQYLDFTGASFLDLEVSDVKNLEANEVVIDGVIFRDNNQGTLSNPNVGDVRITYKAITNQSQGILFALYQNGQFEHLTTPKNNIFYRFINEVTNQRVAINLLDSEHQTTLYIFRLVGFIMMFIGLNLIAKPLMTLLSVIPFLAKIGRATFMLVALVVSLVLTGLMILLGIIFNDALIALIVIGSIVLISFLYLQMKKNKI